MKKFLLLAAIGLTTLATEAQALKDAVKLTDREQFEKAGAAFKSLLATEPQNGEAWFYYGENFWENERPDSAKFCYEHGVEVNPRFPLNHVGLGKVLWAKGDKAAAQVMFEKAVAIACDKANKFSKADQARTYREVAAALAQGSAPDAVKSLEFIAKAVEMDPKDEATYILKGDVLFDQNPRDGTTPLETGYKKAMELAPLDPKPVARKAFMYYRAKNYSAAVDEYTNAIAIDAAFAPAYRGRAEAYFMGRDFDKATADMNKYLELNTGNTSARVRNAQFLFLVKKYDESLQEIKALEGIGVKNIVLKRLLAYDLTEKGEFDAAMEAMTAYRTEQGEDKLISLDYEYLGKIHQGLAKAAAPTSSVGTVAEGAAQGNGTNAAVVVTGITINHDSIAGEMFLKAARMDKTKEYLFVDASKAFSKSKLYAQSVQAMQEKIASGRPEVNDYYYLGDAANKGKLWMTADSAWSTYIQRNPTAYQGYKFRARAQNGMDSLEVKTFAAKPFYDDMLLKMKPEEKDKSKADVEEALNYMALYYLYNKEAKDLPKAKCYFEKVKALNAGTSITAQVNDTFLKMKELKDLAPGSCE